MKNKILSQNVTLLAIVLLGVLLWTLDVPYGVTSEAWHLLIIFICTIIGVVMNPLPIGAITSLGVLACILTKTLSMGEALSGFGDEIVWLIVFAFFISDGFINTGLGSRIAYKLISIFGKNTLGLAYSLVFTDLILSPAIPSVTARGGGILFPIANALSKVFTGDDHHKSHKNGGFFMAVCVQSNVITSAMFLTAMAANPVAVKLAGLVGVHISWYSWALAAFVPGLISLLLMPLVMYYYSYPPSVKKSEEAPKFALEKLKEMGTIKYSEMLMILVFFTLIFFWIFGKTWFGITATSTALMGFAMLLIFRLVSFEDAIANKTAWHTFIWFANLVMMSSFLAKFGIMVWIENKLKFLFLGFSPSASIILLSLVYFYIHYIFASATAHITVFLPTFLLLFIDSGLPPMVAALMLTFLSILSSGLTHFGLASAPIFFAPGYIKIGTWFQIGFSMSLLYLAIWGLVGSAWWKVIGLW
ncbi:MAG UNVERIFIED_CONTAM: anion permease [Planctomycetaceae bacterium]|jgi:DASS family divalent anion:Na+ symporter